MAGGHRLGFGLGAVLFGELADHEELAGHVGVADLAVGDGAGRAVLDAVVGVAEAAAAFVAQRVQGAIAEEAVEELGIGPLMAGEIFALAVLEVFAAVLFHFLLLFLGVVPPVLS